MMTARANLWLASGVAIVAMACSSTDPPGGSGGAGGTSASGGGTALGGTSGSAAVGGSGAVAGAGGAAVGGAAGSGGSSGAGAGGVGTGGGSGGTGGGALPPTGGSGGASGGGAGSGGGEECRTGTTEGSQVLVIGESFIAQTHEITREIERLARANGSLAENESYRDNSISGTTLAGGGDSIPNQYQRGVDQGPVRFVLMDGGGNDCLLRSDASGALSAASALFDNMRANGTEKIVYFFYPDPIGDRFASLKSCLDTLRPQMKALCDGLTSPRCFWLDLREIWAGHREYTDDGIHPTTPGSVASAQAIWDVMVEHCVAQ